MSLINSRTIIGVLIALVVGVPVLAAIFSSGGGVDNLNHCLLYTSPSPRDS